MIIKTITPQNTLLVKSLNGVMYHYIKFHQELTTGSQLIITADEKHIIGDCDGCLKVIRFTCNDQKCGNCDKCKEEHQ